MAAEGMQLPWRWNGGMISLNLGVIWEMSDDISKSSVFIAYAHEDVESALRLYNALRHAGLNPWIDRECLIPGIRWKIAITQAIEDSEYFLALLSSSSVTQKGYVHKEVAEALILLDRYPESHIFLIPVRLDDCMPSHKRLSELQWVDLFPSWDEGLTRLLRAVKSKLLVTSDKISQGELEIYIRNNVNTSKFEKPKSWADNRSIVFHEFYGDDDIFICWSEGDKKLTKWYRNYGGTRWEGPYDLTVYDKQRVKEILDIRP